MDKITSKVGIRDEVQAIYFAPDKMVATDTYRLIEVTKPIDIKEPRLIIAKGFKGRGAVSVDERNIVNDDGKLIQGRRIAKEYPDYEKACFSDAKPKFSMYVNAKYLAELVAEVNAQGKPTFDKIRLDFYGELKPLVITAVHTGEHGEPKVRAALSPMMTR